MLAPIDSLLQFPRNVAEHFIGTNGILPPLIGVSLTIDGKYITTSSNTQMMFCAEQLDKNICISHKMRGLSTPPPSEKITNLIFPIVVYLIEAFPSNILVGEQTCTPQLIQMIGNVGLCSM